MSAIPVEMKQAAHDALLARMLRQDCGEVGALKMTPAQAHTMRFLALPLWAKMRELRAALGGGQ